MLIANTCADMALHHNNDDMGGLVARLKRIVRGESTDTIQI